MKTKTVVIDGYTLNPGDLSWETLESSVDSLEVYHDTNAENVIPRLKDANIVLTNKVVFNHEVLVQLPLLKHITVTATGYNIIDIKTAKNRGIAVSNVSGYSTPSTAQHTFALLLEVTNRVAVHNQAVREGEWSSQEHFCFWKSPLIELQDKVIGLIGYGAIAQQVAQIALAFGMKVIVNHRHRLSSYPSGVHYVALDDLLKNSDVISLHAPLNDASEQLVNANSLAIMKKNAILINTARGGLVNEADLVNFLKVHPDFYACLDVLSVEPPTMDQQLIGLDNCIITPHVAWASTASRKRLLEESVLNVQAFIQGNPRNVIV